MKKDKVVPKSPGVDSQLRDMLEAGLHFGHKKTWQHPRMSQYVFSIRNTVSIIDLDKTIEHLAKALAYIKELIGEGKILLLIDTKPSTRDETRKLAEEIGMPYMVERWSGGTLTNWKTISGRIEYLKDLEAAIKTEDWKKYTKKERSDTKGEINKLNILWGGIKNMDKLPDAVFIVDMHKNALAAKEARKMNIPVVAIVDTNIDPDNADYPIPANDDALSAVKYILNTIREAVLGTKKTRPKPRLAGGQAEGDEAGKKK